MRLASTLALGLAVLSTASTAGGKDSAPLPPPYEGIYQPQGVDEIGLWREDDESEKKMAASPLVISDENLTAYVRDVLCRTVGEDRCKATRVYIVRVPWFNATMSPNGTMRVYSGLLLRMRDESELAAVLGHEFGHFEKRHSLEGFKQRRTGTDLLAWGAVLAGIASNGQANRDYRDLQISVYGHLFRYGRNQEREADLLGLSYLNKSELRPQSASRVWQNLMAEAEASARVRGLRKPNFNAIAFNASHPPNAERATYLAALALPEGATRDAGTLRYREAMKDWLPLFLDDQIKLNDFGASEFILENLAEGGWTAPLLYARGELYRGRGAQRDLVYAAEFYAAAIALDPIHAEAYRGLGLSLIKTGERTRGQEALQRYLELAPEAPDKGMIRLLLPKEEI